MRPFQYLRPASAEEAVRASSGMSMYHGGGTTLIDLMKLDVLRPDRLLDIARIDDGRHEGIVQRGKGLRIGAMTTMARLAASADIRTRCPVLTDSLWLAASAQIRNMARLGGNVLQMTQCTYFRDTSYTECNKRNPGSGCAAMNGVNRGHAVLGTSEDCIAAYPGDWAQALIALDAEVEVIGRNGPRTLRFADVHRRPGSEPNRETNLETGDLITAFVIPDADFARSTYLKIRDRESYAYALASAAVALRMDGDTASEVRIGLGGVATIPWRANEAEAMLKGGTIDESRCKRAADAAFADAKPHEHNRFKIELGKQTLVRALLHAASMRA